MVKKCVAYGCKSGYKSDNKKDVTFHLCPEEAEVCDKLLRANPRKDFMISYTHGFVRYISPTMISLLCAMTNKNDVADSKLVNRYLKKDAVPSIFPNAPSYLSSSASTIRLSAAAATASGRQQQEAECLDTLIEQFEAEDNLTLSEIEDAVQADGSMATNTETDAIADDVTSSLKLDLEPTDSDKNVI
jgi:THAP domain